MEESEKRRERLKAMRMEAARTGVHTDFESPGLASDALSNPLIENETASASPHQYTSPRFDYYTDPMSAFSGSKRRNNISPQVSQGHYNTPSRPMDQGMIPNSAYHYPAMNPPGQGIFNLPRAPFNQSPFGNPMGSASPLNRPQQQNPPSSWGGAFNYGTPPNLSRGGNFTSPYGPGRGLQGQNSSSHYDPGRGRGRGQSYGNNSMSPGSGPGFRRGSGPRDSVSGGQRPDLYYSREMVEDPWRSLNPVMWKGVGDVDSDKSWLPKSIAMKKSKASPETPQVSISQQSLAEYLAASFNDSIDEAVEDEKAA